MNGTVTPSVVVVRGDARPRTAGSPGRTAETGRRCSLLFVPGSAAALHRRALGQVEVLERRRLVALRVLRGLLAGPGLDLRAGEDRAADRVVGDDQPCGAPVDGPVRRGRCAHPAAPRPGPRACACPSASARAVTLSPPAVSRSCDGFGALRQLRPAPARRRPRRGRRGWRAPDPRRLRRGARRRRREQRGRAGDQHGAAQGYVSNSRRLHRDLPPARSRGAGVSHRPCRPTPVRRSGDQAVPDRMQSAALRHSSTQPGERGRRS